MPDTVLAEYQDGDVPVEINFPPQSISRQILKKISGADTRMSYMYDKVLFHYVVEGGLVFLCMSNEKMPRRVTFAFIDDIRGRFVSMFGTRANTGRTLEMNEDFRGVLQRQMEYYSDVENTDQLTKVRTQVEDVKLMAQANIEKVLERGERVELIADKANRLNNESIQFKRASKDLSFAMWMQNMKMKLILGGVIVAVLLIIILSVCGFSMTCS